MARKSKEQILADQSKNKKEITDIFQTVSCFWGIDRVEITNLSIVNIDSDLLAEQRLLLKSKVKYSVDKDSRTGMMKYTRIEINDIGGIKGNTFTFGFTIDGHSFSILSMVHGGINIETVGMQGIRARLSSVTACLLSQYGIRLYTGSATCRKMEIAFTGLFDGRVPIRVRKILISQFGSAVRSYITYSKSKKISKDDMDIQTMEVKNTRAEKTSLDYVLYDKTAELQRKVAQKELPENYDFKIYRFEEKILKSQTIKDLLGTTEVSDLQDSDVVQHISNDIIPTIENGYLCFFDQSVKCARSYLSKWDKNHRTPGWQKNLIHMIIKEESEYDTIKVIDEESFLHLGIGGDNGARTQQRFVHACEKLSKDDIGLDRNPFCRMDGWTVEQFIMEMKTACDEARSNGLGVHRTFCHADSNPKAIHLTYGVIPDKEKILKQLSKGCKDRKDILYKIF